MKVYSKCSDYATDHCPCVLAENGHCIECSMCRGEEYCDCTDMLSFCVYQELRNNGGRAKEARQEIVTEAAQVISYGDSLRMIRLRLPEYDISRFRELGAYVLIRTEENHFYDVPLSVIFEDYDIDSICLLVQIRGIKTKSFRHIKKGDRVYLRGPFYNGILGRKLVAGLHDQKAVVICRQIGMLPSLNVIQTLKNNRNEVTVYHDEGEFDSEILDVFRKLLEIDIQKIRVCENSGELTEEMRAVIRSAQADHVGLIHLGMSEYLIDKTADFLYEIDSNCAVSFINNSHICCGEGICGACIIRTGPNSVIHLCKEQFDIMEIKRNR